MSNSSQLSAYDYVVVGAGAAGCVIASEIVKRQLGSVCVLEAGSWPTSRNLKVPVLYPQTFGSQYDWCHSTVPQNHLAKRRISLPAGKTLGGSTAINAMIYIRAHAEDFRSTIMEELFRSGSSLTECYECIERSIFDDTTGFGVDLTDVLEQMLGPINRVGMAAAGTNRDGFLEPSAGVQRFRRCQRNGRRRGAFDVFLKPALEAGVACLHSATVQRIVFDDQRADAVLVTTAKGTEVIRARKGIVLASGTIGTPMLMLASGIGPKEDLDMAGVAVVRDNPHVGKNLQDHLVFPVIYRLVNRVGLARAFGDDDRRTYAKLRKGPQTSNIAELGGFFQIGVDGRIALNDFASRPTFQWHITPTHYLEYPVRDNPTNAVSFVVTALHPKSRGDIRIRGARERSQQVDAPGWFEIDPNYMSHDEDRRDFVTAVQQTRQWIATGPLSGFFGDEVLPGTKRSSDSQVETTLERFATTIYHYVGTCSMGTPGNGVVGRDFGVYGCSNLTVCDASVIPSQLSCNPQATVMALGMKWAESQK